MSNYWKDPVLRRMWECKGNWRTPFVFAHADLVEPTQIRECDEDCDRNHEHTVTYPAGTRVLCTMVSRFGDVGIRARQIHRIENGYDARVMPEKLRNIVEVKP